MEELDEFEVLWPDQPEPAASSSSPPPVQPSPAEASTPCAALGFGLVVRSRPIDVPRPARSRRSKDGGEEEEDGEGGSGEAIVPPHLMLSGRRRSSETATWMLRTPGLPCKRARDLRHLRNSVLRMTGFIEG